MVITTIKDHDITGVEQLNIKIMEMVVVIAINGKSRDEDVVHPIVIAHLAGFLFEF